jgi:CheY-like chemotaxis protein
MQYTEVDILLVEDNINEAELTIRAFKKCNITNKLIHLQNGADALDFLFATGQFVERKNSTLPKVILLDLKMPKVDGIEVLQRIKKNDLTRKIPVVMLTSSKEDPDVKRCYEFGANSYIVKPVAFDNFHKVVSEIGLYWLLFNQPPSQE